MKKLICFWNFIKLNWKRPFDIPIDGHEYKQVFYGARNGRIEQELECVICGHKEIMWE